MDNGLTFRFEVSEIQKLIDGLDAGAKDHILITYYLDPSAGNNKSYLVAKAEGFTQAKEEEVSLPAGNPAYGCPVPPCR